MFLAWIAAAHAIDNDYDGDGVPIPFDCNDRDPRVFPGAFDRCDLLDNDCDGPVDEGFDIDWYVDADGDGHGDRNQVQPYLSCDDVPGYARERDDCDDGDGTVHPGAAETCDGRDQDCDDLPDDGLPELSLWEDRDEDGFGAGRPWVGCAAVEGPDRWWVEDPDTHQPRLVEGFAPNGDDCSDFDVNVRPGAADPCDGVDNDCDGVADGDAAEYVVWFADADGDGLGDDRDTRFDCFPPRRGTWVAEGGDCDDGDAAVAECPLPEPEERPRPAPAGGCATGAAATGAPGVLLAALALRRRRQR